MAPPPRLIDLHCDWLLQYAAETTTFDPALYPDVTRRQGQANGYLLATGAAVIACSRSDEDWARQGNPWGALGELLARVEAEFPGRLLLGPDDYARWRDDPEGLCWALPAVAGFDALIRETADLDRLAILFDRGVRVFQMAQGPTSVLAGADLPGDGRGLTPLGQDFLKVLADLAPSATGPRPLLDLAHLSPAATADVLAWYEAAPDRAGRLPLLVSLSSVNHPGAAGRGALTPESLRRFRALGGVIGLGLGPPHHESVEALRAGIEAAAAVPFLGREGFEGVALGTGFLGRDATLPGLGNASEVVAWVASTFPPTEAEALLSGDAYRLIRLAAGA